MSQYGEVEIREEPRENAVEVNQSLLPQRDAQDDQTFVVQKNADGEEVSEGYAEEDSPISSVRLRFRNVTPLRKKTLELLRENPDLDGAEADRLARKALGVATEPAPVETKPVPQNSPSESAVPSPNRRLPANRTAFVPAPGSYGTSRGQGFVHEGSAMERLEGLALADRKMAFLEVLSEAARRARG